MKTAAKFKQIDVTRAVRAVQAAGLPVSQVCVDCDGNIVIGTGSAPPDTPQTSFDTWKAKRNAR